jgi:hypothetical protein
LGKYIKKFKKRNKKDDCPFIYYIRVYVPINGVNVAQRKCIFNSVCSEIPPPLPGPAADFAIVVSSILKYTY